MNRFIKYKGFWVLAGIVITALFENPSIALVFGAFIALTYGNPHTPFTSKISKKLLQIAIILSGFGLSIKSIIQVGTSSILLTLSCIIFTFVAGWFIAKILKVDKELSTLISSGTAICGGSAIAAVSPAIGASSVNTGASLAIVFLLNALALVLFPPIGSFLHLDQISFGLWSAIAIHDTSSVVGATSIFGQKALEVGTTVKLTRALWILPLAYFFSRFHKNSSETKKPWFLLGFLLAALIRHQAIIYAHIFDNIVAFSKLLMTVTLFFIGAGLTRNSLVRIGLRPLVMGVILWLVIPILSLIGIHFNYLNIQI